MTFKKTFPIHSVHLILIFSSQNTFTKFMVRQQNFKNTLSCFNYLQRVNGRSKYFFSTSKHMPFTSWKSWMLLIFFKKVVATFSVFLVSPIKYFQKISLKTWKDITRTYFNGQLKTASCFWQFAVWLKKRRNFRLYYSKTNIFLACEK